jgi:hypothetical protein
MIMTQMENYIVIMVVAFGMVSKFGLLMVYHVNILMDLILPILGIIGHSITPWEITELEMSLARPSNPLKLLNSRIACDG